MFRTVFKKVFGVKVHQKRIKKAADGRFYPQYKGLLFWRSYRNPKGKIARFCDMWDTERFMRAKQFQEVEAVKNYTERGVTPWELKS